MASLIRWWALLLTLSLALVTVAGCGRGQREVNVYFGDSQAMYLVPVKRRVADMGGAVKAVLAGPRPDEPGLVRIFPEGVRFLGIAMAGDVAEVNFSAELRDRFGGGSAGETMLVYSVVNTLTEWKGVRAVRFLVEGQPLDTLGHMDLGRPIPREPGLIQAALPGR